MPHGQPDPRTTEHTCNQVNRIAITNVFDSSVDYIPVTAGRKAPFKKSEQKRGYVVSNRSSIPKNQNKKNTQ